MSLTLNRTERRQALAYRKMVRRARRRTSTPRIRINTFRGREINREHKAAIAQLFCVATAIRHGIECYGVHVAHIRFSQHYAGARNPGLQRKPDDRWVLPLCAHEHRLQHSMGERDYWAELGVDPHALAAALFDASPDIAEMQLLLQVTLSSATERATPRSPPNGGAAQTISIEVQIANWPDR